MSAPAHSKASAGAEGEGEGVPQKIATSVLPIEGLQKLHSSPGGPDEVPSALNERVSHERGDLSSCIFENNTFEGAISVSFAVEANAPAFVCVSNVLHGNVLSVGVHGPTVAEAPEVTSLRGGGAA